MKKRKARTFSSELPDCMEDADRAALEYAPLVTSIPYCCVYRHIPSGPTCSKPLFNSVTINDNAHMIPRFKYHAQDLKQWVGWLLLRPTIEEAVFEAFQRPQKERMEDMWDVGHLCRILRKKGK